MRTSLRRAAAVLLAAAALVPVTVAAYDKVDPPVQVATGESRLYYIGEQTAAHQPLVGRQVTMSVLSAPGAGASVTGADAKGHPVGGAGSQASTVSGVDGKAYFLLQTASVPGENDYTWTDGTYTGKVTLVGVGAGPAPPSAGTAPPAPAATPTPAHTTRTPAAVVPATLIGGSGGGGSGGDAWRLLVATLVGLGAAAATLRLIPMGRLRPTA